MKLRYPKNDEMKVKPMNEEHPINIIEMEEDERKISKEVNVSKMYPSKSMKFKQHPKNVEMEVKHSKNIDKTEFEDTSPTSIQMSRSHSEVCLGEDVTSIEPKERILKPKDHKKDNDKTEFEDIGPTSIQMSKSLSEVCLGEDVTIIEPKERVLKSKDRKKNNEKSAFEEYLNIIFPRKVIEDILPDEDIILAESSDLRIIWFLIVASILWFGVILSLGGLILNVVLHQQIILQPHIPYVYTGRIKPSTHFAVVLQNKTVLNVSPQGHVEKMCQLPAGVKKYHGYADETGFLYFIDGELQKPVFQYSKRNGLVKVKTLPYTTLKERRMYWSSASVGPYFWLLSESFVSLNNMNLINIDGLRLGTQLWYKKRRFLYHDGPRLPTQMFDTLVRPEFCTTSLNQTHLMVIGFAHCDNSDLKNYCAEHEPSKRTAIVDLTNLKWAKTAKLKYPSIDLDNDNLDFQGCSATVLFGKNDGTKKVVVHFKTLKARLVYEDEPTYFTRYVQAYDLSFGTNGQWTPLLEETVNWNMDGQITAINGILYSFMLDGSIRGYWANYTDFELTPGFLNNSIIETIVPYLA